MSEEGAAKLRLKPRKAPPPCNREPSPGREFPRPLQTVTDRCSWFEKEDLNECEKTWILLLNTISQDLQCTNWQTVPSFPEFFGKSSEEESLQKQEVFTIGKKDFQWVSFPSFCKEKHLKPKDLSSHQLTQSQIDHLYKGQGKADKLSLPSTAENTCCVTITDQAKNMVGEDAKGISKLDASPKSCKLSQHGSSTHHLTLSQSSPKAFSFQQHCRGTVQNSRENRKENNREELQIQTHQGNISFGEARYVSAEKSPPLVSIPGTESCKEKMENQSEGSSTLDSCPMCLINFSGTLSQLDIDGHLARCLSESADDVMW
ncbi:Fanconi anemia core complex-associated protein 20 isoform X2 [Accipiter gentilis]|uniref:Fanconi anemia core complex-associated protein 20 isoform X2 n=1 Tax=Astur gentilis TaxID=8957 RepID=UPI00210FFC2C|nr:Fanconi anemia core complex-associated protein 20 isoform X2 [Accipiter gentilis]